MLHVYPTTIRHLGRYTDTAQGYHIKEHSSVSQFHAKSSVFPPSLACVLLPDRQSLYAIIVDSSIPLRTFLVLQFLWP